jgi:hypothetical protein
LLWNKVDNQRNRYLLGTFNIQCQTISSEIKEEPLRWPNFIFDLRGELEDRRNQYKVLLQLCMIIIYLNIHFSCSVYISLIICCCHRPNRGTQQSKHFSRHLNMGSKICYNLHNYLPQWKRCLFTPITVQIFNILIIWPPLT